MIDGRLEEAVGFFKKIEPVGFRAVSIMSDLCGYAASLISSYTGHGFLIVLTGDRKEYDNFRDIVGIRNNEKCMLYRDENGIDHRTMEDFVRDVIPAKNPVLSYLDNLLSQTYL